VLRVASAHDHTLRHNISELAWLQVSVNDTESISHLLYRNKLLQARANGAKSALAEINLFHVELGGLWVSGALNYSTDTEI